MPQYYEIEQGKTIKLFAQLGALSPEIEDANSHTTL